MRLRDASLFGLLVLPLLAFSPRADELTFAPADGATLTKSMDVNLEFFLEDLTLIADGQDMGEMIMGEMDEGITISAGMKVTDEFVKTAAGKHLELMRTFEEMHLEGGTDSDTESVDEFGDLEDATILFEWNEEDAKYDKSYHESAGDEELLEFLSPDMDFLGLLPGDEVEEGDEWEVKSAQLAQVFLPGGILGMPTQAEEDEMVEVIRQELETQIDDAFSDFKVVCKYKGQREESEVQVGEVEVTFEGDASLDFSELIQTALDMQADEMEIDLDVSATLAMEFEGKGTLLWNMAAKTVYGFDMGTEITLNFDMDAEVDVMGESHSAEASAEISGEGRWEFATE